MTEGIDAMLDKLTLLQLKAPKVARAAVKQVADEFAKELEKNTPRDESEEHILADHLQDEVVVTGFKGANMGIISKDIGYGRKTGWRSHFPDEGTIYQAPQGFEEKTINTMTPRAKQIYAKKVKEGLKL